MAISKLSNATIGTGTKTSKLWDQSAAYSDMDLIASNDLISDQSSVSFTNLNVLAAAYSHLKILCSVQDTSNGVGSSILFTINSDSGSNYNAASLYGGGTNSAGWAYYSVNTPYCGSSNGYGAEPNSFSALEYFIPDFKSTDKWKAVIAQFSVQQGNGTTGYYGFNNLQWKSTAAITSISLNIPSYSFKAGSTFYLYGIRG